MSPHGTHGNDALAAVLYADEAYGGEASSIRVTVHRATHLVYKVVTWRQPRVHVVLGKTEACSATVFTSEDSPAFAWTAEFFVDEKEAAPYLVFEVLNDEEVLGFTFVPVREIMLRQQMHMALQLYLRGKAKGEQPDQASELFVTIEFLGAEPEPVAEAQGPHASLAVYLKFKQVRVSVRSLYMELGGSDLFALDVHPYVRARLGLEFADTPVAYLTAVRDAEEFVFVDPSPGFIDWNAFVPGVFDQYAAPVRDEPEGSARWPAYRRPLTGRQRDGGLEVHFRDCRFTFWQANPDGSLEIFIFDERQTSGPTCVAQATIAMLDAFRVAAAQAEATPCFARTGLTRVNLQPVSVRRAEPVADENIGHVILEVEFFQDVLASPNPLEDFFRRSAQTVARLRLEQQAVLDAVLSMLPVMQYPTRTLQNVTADLRWAFARALVQAVSAGSRRVVRHEADVAGSARLAQRNLRMVTELAELLQLPRDGVAELETVAREATCHHSQRHLAQALCEQCDASRLDPYVLVACMIAQCLERGNINYSATMRMAMLDTAAAISEVWAVRRVAPRRLFTVMERYVTVVLHAGTFPPYAPLFEGSMSAEAMFRAARPVAEQEGRVSEEERQRVSAQHAASFFPDIDIMQVIGPKHPGKLVRTNPAQAGRIYPMSAAGATVAALLGAWGIRQTAELVHDFNVGVICNRELQKTLGFLTHLCNLARESSFDDFMAKVLSRPPGFALSFIVYFGIYFSIARWRLMVRWSIEYDISLECWGPSHSPHAVVCASGFLSNFGDIFTPWLVNTSYPWTDGHLHAIRFGADILLKLRKELLASVQKNISRTTQGAQLAVAFTNPLSMSFYLVDSLFKELDDLIDRACHAAQQAGVALAHRLLAAAGTSVVSSRPVSLFGFSTGCVAIHSCLKELRRIADDENDDRSGAAVSTVCDVVMLGGPISNSDTEEWTRLRLLANGRFVCGFMRSDFELWLHSVRRFAQYIGIAGLHYVPGVENVAMEQYIISHSQYLEQTPAILNDIMCSRMS